MPLESGRWICKHASGGYQLFWISLGQEIVMNACPFILGVAVSLCFIHSLSGCNFIIVIGCLGGPYPNLCWQLHQGFSPRLHLQSGAGSTLIPVSMCQGLVTQLVDSIGISSREPRLIFTAGAMGVGKSHVIRWMKEKDILPLHDFAAGLHKPVIFCQNLAAFLSFSCTTKTQTV